MFCPSCGNDMSDDAKFCGACGSKLGISDSQAQTTQAAPSSAVSDSQPTPISQVAPVATAQYQKGVLGQAWTDITASPGWVKRVLLLMVMNVVPILNLFATGYILQWGADASRGIHQTLPKERFDLRCFLTGLFYFFLSMLLAVASFWTGILALIPIVGWIAMVVIPLFANAFLAMAGMRMAIFGRFGAAFELSDLFSKYKRRLGQLFAASFVPSLIVVAVVCVLLGILALGSCSAGSGILGTGMRGFSYGYYPSPEMMGMALMGTGVGLFFFVLILVVTVFFAGFAQVWTLRAVGIWAARVAPEWQEEAAQEQLAKGGAKNAPNASA